MYFVDEVTARIFADAFAGLYSFDLARMRVEEVRWNFRILTLTLLAIGIYFLVGILLEPIRRATEFQKRFIANLSHELKTPLITAKTETDVALRNPNQLTHEEALALLERNRDAITHFSRIVQFLTTLSDLSSQKILTTLQPVALTDVVTRVTSQHVERADHAVKLRIVHETDEPVIGNPLALEQLVTNLLRNAITHTPPGGSVTIRTRKEGAHVVLSIEDMGVGIPAEEVSRVFEPFYRAETAAKGGAGLGLSIVREIARIHHARLSLTSTLGKGTTVSVSFPAA